MKKTAVLVLLMSSLAITACNTVEGMGKDISAAGRAVTGAAHDSKPSEQKK